MSNPINQSPSTVSQLPIPFPKQQNQEKDNVNPPTRPFKKSKVRKKLKSTILNDSKTEGFIPNKLMIISKGGKISGYTKGVLDVFKSEETEIETNKGKGKKRSMETCTRKLVTLHGKGDTINKTISIAEIIKRNMDGKLHQYNMIGWEPIELEDKSKIRDPQTFIDSDDKIQIPFIKIHLSTQQISEFETKGGYQPPTFHKSQ
ncbi:hypothetical protein G9A89_016216 [Geosiphon pyriformis]|nr:hypothetical protein G9A89_016216 [Geosiphon pyriformis]